MDIEKIFAVEAEQRMKSGVKADPVELIPQGRSVEKAAAALKTNDNYVKAAKKLEKDAPDLLEKVKLQNLKQFDTEGELIPLRTDSGKDRETT